MVRELTCIVCPMGCHLTVTIEEGKEIKVEGNTCPRGAAYGKNECTHPMRAVTSTVRLTDGRPCAVKTDTTIPKEKMMDCMTLINHAHPSAPVHIGDVIVADAFGAKIVATENLE